MAPPSSPLLPAPPVCLPRSPRRPPLPPGCISPVATPTLRPPWCLPLLSLRALPPSLSPSLPHSALRIAAPVDPRLSFPLLRSAPRSDGSCSLLLAVCLSSTSPPSPDPAAAAISHTPHSRALLLPLLLPLSSARLRSLAPDTSSSPP